MTLRIAPVEPGTRPELAGLEAGILAERGRISLLYQVLLNSPSLAQGWEQMLTAVRNRSSVAADLREMIILRVAVLNRAPYEFEAHVPHALKAGLNEEKIAALHDPWETSDLFSGLELQVLRLTDAMTRDIEVSDEVFAPLRKTFNEQTLIELVATAAAYNMVSRFLVALHIGH
jgi:4-carboxymuconolactone decarboxylase